MKRKLVSILLVFAMALSLIPATWLPVSATEPEYDIVHEIEGGTLYFRSETGAIVKSQVTGGIQIPETIEGYAVKVIADSAFSGRKKLTEIQFPYGLQEIGENAFNGCTALTAVELPNSLRTLGAGAFMGCSALEKVILSDALTEISDSAFNQCKVLREVQLPAGIKRIGNNAFNSNYRLQPMIFPEGLEEIGESAFSFCYQITEVAFPETLRYIGDGAFINCKMKAVDLPNSLEKLGTRAFYGCEAVCSEESGCQYVDDWFVACTEYSSYTVKIREGTVGVADGSLYIYHEYGEDRRPNVSDVYIPASVIHMDHESFGTKNKVYHVVVDKDNPVFSDYNSILFNKDKTEVIFCGTEVGVSDLALPTNLKKIGESAFRSCKNLKSITLPDSVEYIGKTAFQSTGLQSIVIGTGLRMIDDKAFAACKDLKMVRFAGDAPAVGEDVFVSCPDAMLFYFRDKEGWTTPTWNGYLTVPQGGTIETTAFGDISPDAYYYDAVLWAVDRGITNGTGYGMFSPDKGCNRGQVVTFLWRAEGCPEVERKESPFTDIFDLEYYYDAVLWAVENGITSGTGKGCFSPYYSCTRGQIVTFLWRTMGMPKAESGNNPFRDVSPEDYYYEAVLWAVENGITTGMSADTFAPNKVCTRGQIVTFLYRAYH